MTDILRKTRCRYVFVGVESADDNVLRSMRKGITRNQIEKALEIVMLLLNGRTDEINSMENVKLKKN